jgi:hypothetical protein
MTPIETTEITAAERTRIMCDAVFKVTTVVPLLDRPHRNVYVLNREEFDTFLADVLVRAEYVIAVEEVAGDLSGLLRRLGDGVPS